MPPLRALLYTGVRSRGLGLGQHEVASGDDITADVLPS